MKIFTRKSAVDNKISLVDIIPKKYKTGYLFIDINNDLNVACEETYKQSPMLIMAAAYARRTAAAAIYLQRGFSLDQYEHIAKVFKSTQLQTGHSVEFQKQAFSESILFMQSYSPLISSSLAKKIVDLAVNYERPESELSDADLIKMVIDTAYHEEQVAHSLNSQKHDACDAESSPTSGFPKKNKIQQLIDNRGYEQAVKILACSIIERLPNRVVAYEFILQELDGASMGDENSMRAAANSGIPRSHYKEALKKDVPEIESAQDHITNYSFQLFEQTGDQELMARFRVDIVQEVMRHFEFGKFSHSFGTFEPPTFEDDDDLGRNFVVTSNGFKVSDRATGDVLQAVIKDGMFHGSVFINAKGMSAGLAPWSVQSNPFEDDLNFCGSGNSPAGPWVFSITPSVPFTKILELAREQHEQGNSMDDTVLEW